MHAPPRRTPRLLVRLYLIAAALATVAQLVLVVAPVFEGWAGVGMRAHVEAHTNPLHHAHDQATCVACQVRSLYGVAGAHPAAPAVHQLAIGAPVLREQRIASAGLVAHALPRAPPCVI